MPTVIGGGAGEIALAGGGSALILTSSPFGSGNAWVSAIGGFGETIQGPGGSSLGVSAIAFRYFSQLGGMYNFHHGGGVDLAPVTPAGRPLFVGWVGGPGQARDFVDYTPGTASHVLDSIVTFVPAPGALALLGAAAVAGPRRRRCNGGR